MTTKFRIGDRVVRTTNPEEKYIIESFSVQGTTGEIMYILKDTGGMRCLEQFLELDQESPKKFDNDKPRLDLIRPEFILGLGEVLAYGAEKYDEPVGTTPNYLKGDGFNYSRILGSLERHIQQFKMGENIDPESGKHHLKHAAANLMFLLTYEESEKGIDDRIILEKK